MAGIPDMLRSRVKDSPSQRAYTSFVDGRWKNFTWADYEARVRDIALGLIDLGIQRGDVVAILGGTRAEWALCDVGALCAGAVTVGLYPTLQPEGIGSMHYVLDHSEARVVFVDNAAVLRTRLGPLLAAKLPRVTHIIVWDHDAEAQALDPRVMAYSDLLARGVAAARKAPDAFARACDAARAEDLALLIYTSGTTGNPKGAMLSHGNVCELQKAVAELLPKDDATREGGTVSFLPMAHAAERCLAHYGRIQQGYATTFARSMETLLDDLAQAKPTRFGSVPRIFEKVYARVQGELSKASGLKGKLANAAFAAGLRAHKLRQAGESVDLRTRALAAVFQRRIAGPLRARFGGRCGFFISGAAPIATEILEFFEACGMPTYEAYGLTETTAILTFNRPGALRYGTVGRAIPCVELKIAADGEVLARGPNIFMGYYKDPAATAEAMEGGWFHTGDIGVIDADGFLKITDRKKNILVTAGGKNITPSNLENEVKNHPLVSYCHLHADKRPFVTALICLDPDTLKALAADKGLGSGSVADLAGKPEVRAAVQAAIDGANARFAQYERIKKFAILPAEFSVDGGELTPTLKVKRKEVDKKYASVIDAMYSGGGAD